MNTGSHEKTARFLSLLRNVKPTGQGTWETRCPTGRHKHNDADPSMTVTETTDRILVKCHRADTCTTEDVVAAVGLTMRDLFFNESLDSETWTPRGPAIAVYPYTDENGVVLFEVCRTADKQFPQRRPDPTSKSGYAWRLNGVRRVPFHLPQLLKGIAAGRGVFLAEGEKDSLTLESLGLVASTSPGGAGKWRAEYAPHFRGATVFILPDNDDVGRDHAEMVARSLDGTAKEVRIVRLPGLAEHGDVTDWVRAGGVAEQLKAFARQTPRWTPSVVSVVPAEESAPRASEAADTSVQVQPLRPFPALDDAALYGLAGEIVRGVDPYTEADPVAVLTQVLAAFGNALNRGAHFQAGADVHALNLFVLLVGRTAGGRKGSSWSLARRLMVEADDRWASDNITSGLSSGEGLVWAVRDPIKKQQPIKEKGRVTGYDTIIEDPGIADKRLLVLEAEFASTLRVMGREGNILSAVLRQAWDTGTLRVTTKNNPARATNAHISVVAHVTSAELRATLDRVEMANGFLNRFLVCCVRRSKYLPDGEPVPDDIFRRFGRELHAALDLGRTAGELRRDTGAKALWTARYPTLSEGRPGLVGSALSRAEAQVMRLATLYAILDRSPEIQRPHLEAALALWQYVEESARYLFGERFGDPDLDRLMAALLAAGEAGLSRTQIRELFSNNKSEASVGRMLASLADLDRASATTRQTGGRPAEIWIATAHTPTTETTKATKDPGSGVSVVSVVPPATIEQGDAWEPESAA